jgi:general secretion pathway protein H
MVPMAVKAARAMMRISATGKTRLDERGFTLVELLIVLVIIGLLSAAVAVAMPDPRGSLTSDAERFAARVRAAQDRAVIDGRAMAVRVTSVGYGFDRRSASDWQKLDRRPFVDQRWEEGVEAIVGGSGAARIPFDATGLAEPATVTLSRDGEQVIVTISQDGSIDVVT